MEPKKYILPKLNIVLVEPEIPPNTGSISRLAVGIGASLHLVGKLGFDIGEKSLKRAGIDYWNDIDLHFHDSLDSLFALLPHGRFYFSTKKTSRLYTQVQYKENDFIVFGKETKGLPEELLQKNKDTTITIPMSGRMRSLNLSNAVSIVAYEMIRQFMSAGTK